MTKKQQVSISPDKDIQNKNNKAILFMTMEIMMICNDIVRREGLLALCHLKEDFEKRSLLDVKSLIGYDYQELLVTGLQLVIDGTEDKIFNEYFNNRINYSIEDEDADLRVFFRLVKIGLKCIREGENNRVLALMMDSVIPMRYREKDCVNKLLSKDLELKEDNVSLLFGEEIV